MDIKLYLIYVIIFTFSKYLCEERIQEFCNKNYPVQAAI
jgi:hypothetical protein